jgi:hypothetical protein
MDNSPNLVLPYIQAAQAQKHITHNEAIRALDAIVQISVVDRDLSAPPGAPVEGQRYLIAAAPSGAWSGQAGKIAAWQDGAWMFYSPNVGWVAYVEDEAILIAYGGSAWNAVSSSSSVALLGINTTADTTNRLSIRSDASLFDNVGGGHQHKINKAAAGDTASLLYQTGYSGRAEVGLSGDDKLHVKVSADGSVWFEAMVADGATGFVGFGTSTPATRLTVEGAMRVGRYVKSALPPAGSTDGAGAMIYVWDDVGGAVLAFSDGTSWRRVTDRAVIA